MKRRSRGSEISTQGWTYSCGGVNSQHTLRLIKCEEARLANFIMTEELGIRSGLYSTIDATETVEKNRYVSQRIDEAQENSISFEEMGVSKWAKLSGIVSSIN